MRGYVNQQARYLASPKCWKSQDHGVMTIHAQRGKGNTVHDSDTAKLLQHSPAVHVSIKRMKKSE